MEQDREGKEVRMVQPRWGKSDIIVMVFQLVLSMVFLYLLKKILPIKYWLVITMVLALLCLLVFCKMKSLIKKIAKSKKRSIRKRRIRKKKILKLFSGCFSAILVLSSIVAGQGLGTLYAITGSLFQTEVVSVVVKKDSGYEKIEDIDGKNLGLVRNLDKENVKNILGEITEKTSVNEVDYTSVIDMASALMNGDVEAILLSEAYRGLIEDENASFTDDTKIIYEYKVKQKLDFGKSDVKVTKESFNIYVSGIDTYGAVSSVSRSDVNMILTVNPKTKEILMTSIPRDYYVELASYGKKDKLTHAGIYGVEESMATLENLFGIEIDYYARVNFTSLINIVNALGGITVYNDSAFTCYYPPFGYYPAGEVQLNGEQALEYVRERYNLEHGDEDRVKNQQEVLKGLFDKAVSPAIILNYKDVLGAVSGSFITSMSSKDIQKLIQMQLNDMSSWEIQQISVTGRNSSSTSCYSMPGPKLYVMEPDQSSIDQAIQKMNEFLKNTGE